MAKNPEIKIVVTGETQDVTTAFNAINKELDGLEDNAKQAGKALDEAFKNLGIKSAKEIQESRQKIVNSFVAIKESGETTSDEVIRAFKAMEKELEKVDGSTKKAKNSFEEMDRAFAKSVKNFLKIGIAFAGFTKAIDLVKKGFMTGFDAVNTFQLTVTSLAASMATFNKEADPSQIVEQYEEFREKAETIVPVMDQLAAKTLLSGEAVNRMVLEFAKGGQIIDSTNKEQISSLQNIANALGVVLGEQANIKQIGQEVGDLWQGQITMASSLGQVLKGVIGPGIKQQLLLWKQQGILIQEVGKRLGAFGAASKDLENTWTAVKSTLETTVNTILRKDFAPINEEIVNLVRQFNELLLKNPEILSNIIISLSDIVSLVGDLSSSIIKVTSTWQQLKDLMSSPEQTADVKAVGAGLEEIDNTLFKNLIPGLGHVIDLYSKWRDRQREITENAKQATVFNTQDVEKAVDIAQNITQWQEKSITNIKTANGELLKQRGNSEKIVKQVSKRANKEQEITDSLTEQLNRMINTEQKLVATDKSVAKIIDKFKGLNEQLDISDATEGLNEHAVNIKKIQSELDKAIKKHGLIPELVDEATKAILKEVDAMVSLNSELSRSANLAAQKTIADLSEDPLKRAKAQEDIRDEKLRVLAQETNDLLKKGADDELATEAFNLKEKQIEKEHSNEIKKINEDTWDFLEKGNERVAESASSANREIPRLTESLNQAADATERIAKAMEKAAKDTAKASKFGKALSLDTVGSLALERNLSFAGRGGFPSRSLESLGTGAGNLRQIVPESFQQESRMRAIQEVLSREATGQDTGFSEEGIQGLRDELLEKFGISFGARGKIDQSVKVNNVYNINTPNASSFRASQKQLSEESNRQAEQAARRTRQGGISAGTR